MNWRLSKWTREELDLAIDVLFIMALVCLVAAVICTIISIIGMIL